MSVPQVRRCCVHSYLPGLIRSDGVVVDLGANRGDFARHISEKYGCTIHAMEPVTEFYSRLRQIDGVTVHTDCLSPRSGPVELHRHGDADATLYPRSSAQPRSRTFQASGVTLQEFLERESLGDVDLLKMDVEGAELPVLETTPLSVLRRIRQITVEFHDWKLLETSDRVEAVMRRLARDAFYCIKFSGNNGDVLFVRRDLMGPGECFYIRYCVRNAMGAVRLFRRLILN